jgi:hypothetical protein
VDAIYLHINNAQLPNARKGPSNASCFSPITEVFSTVAKLSHNCNHDASDAPGNWGSP